MKQPENHSKCYRQTRAPKKPNSRQTDSSARVQLYLDATRIFWGAHHMWHRFFSFHHKMVKNVWKRTQAKVFMHSTPYHLNYITFCTRIKAPRPNFPQNCTIFQLFISTPEVFRERLHKSSFCGQIFEHAAEESCDLSQSRFCPWEEEHGLPAQDQNSWT